MKNNFIENATIGRNKWWHYVISILSAVAVIALVNVLISLVLPNVKQFFPDNDFGKNILTYSLVLVIFGLALFAFLFVASKQHRRPKMSFITNQTNLSWKMYFVGFFSWGSFLFISLLISDYDKFDFFIANFNINQFIILFLFGFVAIGVQSFFEEVLIRGYFLQGLHLHIKKITILVIVNALIFGILHFGYGIDSFLNSWFLGIAFALIVILQNSLEFVSGAHNANNLLLSIVFMDLSEAAHANFSWTINWFDLSLEIFTLTLLVGLVYKFFRK